MQLKGVCTCFRMGKEGQVTARVRLRGNSDRCSSRLFRGSNFCQLEPIVRCVLRLTMWNVACSHYSRTCIGVVGRAFGTRTYGPMSTTKLDVAGREGADAEVGEKCQAQNGEPLSTTLESVFKVSFLPNCPQLSVSVKLIAARRSRVVRK